MKYAQARDELTAMGLSEDEASLFLGRVATSGFGMQAGLTVEYSDPCGFTVYRSSF